ncbi:MAG: HAD-IIIA family hydrolase [Candidatus Competibacterales bacterium]|nr:HAD-IIIA family hydrolase [Candidatus Competibacterales bacterium]
MNLVILGRDGVINPRPLKPLLSPEDWAPLPGSLEAIARLTHADYRVTVATNQSGIGRKLFDIDTLNRIHDRMCRQVQSLGGAIELVVFCPETDNRHPDRKPNPGMLHTIARRLGTGLQRVPVIGDEYDDIQAARSGGAQPLLVLTGLGENTRRKLTSASTCPIFADLADAVDNGLLAARTKP